MFRLPPMWLWTWRSRLRTRSFRAATITGFSGCIRLPQTIPALPSLPISARRRPTRQALRDSLFRPCPGRPLPRVLELLQAPLVATTTRFSSRRLFPQTVPALSMLLISIMSPPLRRSEVPPLGGLPRNRAEPLAIASLFVDPAANDAQGTKIIVDGVEDNGVDVPVSSIKAIAVDRNPYSAEFGRPGKGRIEVTTRSGST